MQIDIHRVRSARVAAVYELALPVRNCHAKQIELRTVFHAPHTTELEPNRAGGCAKLARV
jgi:hypothetical protein